MQFWCSAGPLNLPWTWTWTAYVGVWLFIVLLVAGTVAWNRAGARRAGLASPPPDASALRAWSRHALARARLADRAARCRLPGERAHAAVPAHRAGGAPAPAARDLATGTGDDCREHLHSPSDGARLRAPGLQRDGAGDAPAVRGRRADALAARVDGDRPRLAHVRDSSSGGRSWWIGRCAPSFRRRSACCT